MLSMTALVLTLALAPAVSQEDTFGIEVYDYLAGLQGRGFAGVVLVTEGDERILAEGFGLADRENEVPWSTETHSTVGSISKQFTAAGVMKLVEQGRLAVADTLAKHFDDVPDDKRAITLHQLLTHSSGLDGLDAELGDADWIGRDDFVRSVLERPLQFAPGERYEYSNAGYSFLAAIIEKAGGKSYEEFLRSELFLPAGMKATGFRLPDYDPERIAVGYRQGERWGTMLADMYCEEGPSWILCGNGGMYSTAEDMARWVQALVEHRVLSKESVEALWTPYVDESNGRGESFYGYGWVVFELGDTRVIWHNGGDGNGSFFNDIMWVPDLELLVFLQTNDAQALPETEDIALRIVQRRVAKAPLPE